MYQEMLAAGLYDSAEEYDVLRMQAEAEFEEEIEEKEVKKDMDKLLYNRVWLKSGAFLIIEQLESFNAIDVNTGKYTGKKYTFNNNIISFSSSTKFISTTDS